MRKQEAVCPQRNESTSDQIRIVSQLLTLMDGLETKTNQPNKSPIIVIGATSKPNDLDPALRRHGRFDHEIWIGNSSNFLQSVRRREKILRNSTLKLAIHSSFEENKLWEKLATKTIGYVAADLDLLCKESAMIALRRNFKKGLEKGEIFYEDFEEALKIVKASQVRKNIQIEVPQVKWEEIGGLGKTKELLKKTIEWPLLYRHQFKKFNIKPSKGILLYGPPGCCKVPFFNFILLKLSSILLLIFFY